MSTFSSSLANFKQSLSTKASSLNASDWTNAPKRALLFPMDHPLRSVAVASFATFATIPIAAFVCFLAGTLIATTVVGIVWEVFMLVLGAIGLTMALTMAACVSLCCTGAATCVYVACQVLVSSLCWAKRTSTTGYRSSGSGTEGSLSSQHVDKED